MMKPHVDYATNYDTGTDAVTAIQPVINGEAASQNTFRRPPENLRIRTETQRSVLDELLYFRDKPTYQLACAGAGKLSWAGTVANGGSGVLDNTTELTISPLGGGNANTKGVIGIGTAGTNRVNYTVPAGVYATHGVNRWSVEHRPVTGQASIQVNIGAGPNYFILVTYDDTNNSHDAFAVAVAVNLAIAGNAGTAGKLAAAGNAISSNAVSSSSGPVTFFDGVVSATKSGTPTVDIEAHTLPAGALGTLTTSTPLVEDATILIAYRDLIEPSGGDPDDPKTVLAGGRAESNPARSNTNVVANLVILSGAATDGLHLSGAIPLVRIVRGVARFVDGTAVAGGYSLAPGASLGTEFDPSGFSGPTDLENNGGLLTTDDTLEKALLTADKQLARRRVATWTVTNNDDSVGGDFNTDKGIQDAVTACDDTGGVIHVRRGVYLGPDANLSGPNVTIVGEDGTFPEWGFAVNDIVFTGPITFKNMRLKRYWGVFVTINGGARFENCIIDTGLFDCQGGSNTEVELIDCTMEQTSQAATPIFGLRAHTERLTVRRGKYTGPDSTVAPMSGTPDTRLGVFDVLDTGTHVDIQGADVRDDTRAGWRPITRESSNTNVALPSGTVELLNGGRYRSTSDALTVGKLEDLSTSKETTRFGGMRGSDAMEPSRLVFHPALTLDLNDNPDDRVPPDWGTPELELYEITDPRAAPVTGYVAVPASVTLTDLGASWRVAFASDARGTLARFTEGDVVEIVDTGFFRVRAVNLDAPNGSLLIQALDSRDIPGGDTPPAGTQTMRYYRVARGHIGGLSDTTLGVRAWADTDEDMDYLDGTVDIGVEHALRGGVVIAGEQDGNGGFAVGRVRSDLSPTGDTRNFTPDFIVGRDGVTYARNLFVKAATIATATITTLLGVGAILDVESALTALIAAMGTFDGSSGEWNYASPLSFPIKLMATTGHGYGSGLSWSYAYSSDAAHAPYWPTVSGVDTNTAHYMMEIRLPRGFSLTSLAVTLTGTAPVSSGSVQINLWRAGTGTVIGSAVGLVGNTFGTTTITTGLPYTVAGEELLLTVNLSLADTCDISITDVVANGTIPGPR